MMRALVLAILALMLLCAVLAANQADNDGLPLVSADYQRCVTIRNGPLQRPDGYSSRPYHRRNDMA